MVEIVFFHLVWIFHVCCQHFKHICCTSGVRKKFSWGVAFALGVRCLWRHNLTSYSCFQTNVLAKFLYTICILIFYTHFPYFMCHCTESKLSALQVRISEENALNATTQQFITAKISGCALKQRSKRHSSPGPMRRGSSRNIVPVPDSYGGARDWRNIWLFVTNKLGIIALVKWIPVIKLVWPKGFGKLVWCILKWIAGSAFSWYDVLIVINSNYLFELECFLFCRI